MTVRADDLTLRNFVEDCLDGITVAHEPGNPVRLLTTNVIEVHRHRMKRATAVSARHVLRGVRHRS